MKLSTLKADPRVDAGAWVSDIPSLPGVRLKVRPAGNLDAVRINRQVMSSIPRARKLQGVDPADERAAVNEALVGAILLDWDGIFDENGKPVPYSVELARDLIAAVNYRDEFREGVIWASVVVREIGELTLKDTLGN